MFKREKLFYPSLLDFFPPNGTEIPTNPLLQTVDLVRLKTLCITYNIPLVIDATFATIVEALSKGDKVPVVGFGTFAVSERAAREGHNPRTGAKVSIPARKAPTFKAGSALKEAVNK